MKILQILTRDKNQLAASKAGRKAKQLKRKQESLIDNLEDQRDDLMTKKDELENISMDSNIDNWNEEYQDVQVQLMLLDKKIEIAKTTMQDLFADEEASN